MYSLYGDPWSRCLLITTFHISNIMIHMDFWGSNSSNASHLRCDLLANLKRFHGKSCIITHDVMDICRWFRTCFIFPYFWKIIPIDYITFFRGVQTTNQTWFCRNFHEKLDIQRLGRATSLWSASLDGFDGPQCSCHRARCSGCLSSMMPWFSEKSHKNRWFSQL